MTSRKDGEQPDGAAVPQGVVRAFNRNRSFAEEVLRENERLRYRNLDLQRELVEARSGGVPPKGADVSRENEILRRQLDEIREQFEELRRENEDYRQRFQDVERQNESLLNMYVSSYQLHGTLNEETVVAVVKEILLNLVGAEVFAVWLVDPASGRMELTELVDEPGVFGGATPVIPVPVWQAVRGGESWYGSGPGGEGEPLCCIPLKVDEVTAGVLGIYRLLVQKSGFSALDQELLGLLAGQAGASLIGARTFTRSGMKLTAAPPATPPAAPAGR
jgi:hypothetical protein